MTTKYWWARIGDDYDRWMPTGCYGRWMPTGCTDKTEAEDYLLAYFGGPRTVREWLLL